MTKRTRTTRTNRIKRSFRLSGLSCLACLAGAVFPAAVLGACATDNGDAVHGPQFGPPPERPDGTAADGPSPSDEGGSTPNPEAGPDAGTDGAILPTCTGTGTVAVLAGGDSALSGAVQINGGAWTGATIAGGAAKSVPALVAFGTGFVGLTRGPSDALQAVSYGASWSASAVGTLTTLGSPALALLGTNVEAVYLSGPASSATANKFFRIENTGASWSTTGDPVISPSLPLATQQSFGPTSGTVAAAGAELAFAQDGSNNGLYQQKRSGGVWSDAAPIIGAGTFSTGAPPALVAVDGKYDLVLLYADNTATHVIGFATRDSTSKVWSDAAPTQATAQTGEQMSVVRLSPTALLVTFRGNNGRPYVMTGTLGAASLTWSVPVPLLADTSTVDSVPALAKGVCGDDAVAVFAAGGQIKATRYRANAWSLPTTVNGASGTRVSVATR